MNLCDLSEINLQQDEWSKKSLKLGKEESLTVVGWDGRNKTGHKLYIVKCSKCTQDPELFGDGYFKTTKSSLSRGNMPCGCAAHPRWSESQYAVLCSRKANKFGYTFLGFSGQWDDQKTRARVLCEKHGEWGPMVGEFVNKLSGCARCGTEKPDEEMIATFFNSGCFHPNTEFKRSDRVAACGRGRYWSVHCSECGDFGEGLGCNLMKGHRPCGCSNHNQKEAYINFLSDDITGLDVAIKFGIATNSRRRLSQINVSSIYKASSYAVYLFNTAGECKRAEKDCKKELQCGILPKQALPNGYTETTWLYNLEKIIEIYERNGGVKIE